MAPAQQLEILHRIDPDLPLLPRDIYNHNATTRRELRIGESSTQALLEHLIQNGIYHRVLLGAKNRVQNLFITCPESLDHLQRNFEVILIDNTYRTNRFDMPLMVTIG